MGGGGAYELEWVDGYFRSVVGNVLQAFIFQSAISV